MGAEAKAKFIARQQRIATAPQPRALKKTAPFQGRGQSDREEVTPNARFQAFGENDSGTEPLTMYFGSEWLRLPALQPSVEQRGCYG